jgi:hypothetical protein
MKLPHRFIPQTPEIEPVNEFLGTKAEEYIRNDTIKSQTKSGLLVYDYTAEPEIPESSFDQQKPIYAQEQPPKKGLPRINRYYDHLPSYYKPAADEHTLLFESRFESGNLHKAFKHSDLEYDLHLKHDYNTTGFTQWYFFQIKNARKDTNYLFNIVNFMKNESNYNQGMKPLVYSVKKAE